MEVLLLVLSLLGAGALAFSGGVDPGSMGAQGCGLCHSGGAGTTTANVAFSYPLVVGQPATITVDVTNASQTAAGFTLDLTVGDVAAVPGTNAQFWTSTGVSHDNPDSAAPFQWTIDWTPATDGLVSYTLWAVAVNQAGGSTGDTPLASAVTGVALVAPAVGTGTGTGATGTGTGATGTGTGVVTGTGTGAPTGTGTGAPTGTGTGAPTGTGTGAPTGTGTGASTGTGTGTPTGTGTGAPTGTGTGAPTGTGTGAPTGTGTGASTGTGTGASTGTGTGMSTGTGTGVSTGTGTGAATGTGTGGDSDTGSGSDKGCGCTSSPGGAPWGALLLVALSRRRRHSDQRDAIQ